MEIGTGCQAQNLFPVQLSLRYILNILHTSSGIRITGVSDETGQAVAFPGAPFCIHQHGKTVLKGNGLELRILQLGRESFRHDSQAHFLQLAYSFIAQHGYSPLL